MTGRIAIAALLAMSRPVAADTVPDPAPPAPAPVQTAPDGISLNAGFWLNYTLNAFDQTDRDKVGDFGPGNSMFRLGFDVQHKGIIGSVRLRWYSYARVWEYGWVGYRWDDESQLEIGMTKVPFGVLPYSSYDYWFNIPYYLGKNNQYDVGIKWSGHLISDILSLQTGFFKSSDIAAVDDLARFSYDVVTLSGEPSARNEETNKVVARLAATSHHTEVGVSAQYGGLYNYDTGQTGHEWAAALHVDGNLAGWSFQAQAMQYLYKPINPVGASDQIVFVGAFADAFPIAASGRLLELDVGYNFRIGKLIDNIKCYNNHSILLKAQAGFADSEMNILGCSILAGPIFGFVDLVSAKNAPYIGAPTNIAFTTGEPTSNWHSMFNVNIGYYFKSSPLPLSH
jgi:hypothetical protein